MKKTFIVNLIFIILLNVLIKPFWIFGIDRSVQNALDPSVYGHYFALLNLSYLFNIALDFGITNFNKVNIARHSQLLNKHFSGIVGLRFLLGIFYAIITVGSGVTLGYSFEQMGLLYLLVVNQFLISFIFYIRSNIAGLHLFKADAVMSVLDRVVVIAICSVLLWGPLSSEFKIEWFVYAQLIANLFSVFIGFAIVLKQSGKLRLKLNKPFSILMIKKSFPYALLVLLMTFYMRVDAVMLERMLPDGSYQAGLYAMGFRVLDAVNMVGFLFAGILLPMFARMIQQKKSVESLTVLSFKLLTGISVITAMLCLTYRVEIMELMYENTESSLTFGILMLTFIPFSIIYIFGTLLTASGDLKQLNQLSMIGLLVNVGLNAFLIPEFGIVGAATASIATLVVVCAAQIGVVYRAFKFSFNLKLIGLFVVFVGVVYGISFSLREITSEWVVNFIVSGIASVIVAIILGFFSVKSFIQLLQSKATNA